ncbi:MAG: hypothetical protein GY765_29370 [bacterium]|nr:hypothetical protein [bacterium]
MKEHFDSVKSLVGQSNFTPFHLRGMEGNRKNSPESIEQEDKMFKANPEDSYDSRMKQMEGGREEGVADMDIEEALDIASSISRMAGSKEGRGLMSSAHNPISGRDVLRLFGVS